MIMNVVEADNQVFVALATKAPSYIPPPPPVIFQQGPFVDVIRTCTEGAYTASPEDCAVYYVCAHGTNIPFRCQDGLHW